MTPDTNTHPAPPATIPTGRDKPTSYPLLIVVMLIAITPMVALSQILAHWRLDVVDDQMFAYYGWRIANGATVYVDVWDNKPPGIYWTNALGFLFSGESYAGVVALCIIALVVAHLAFFVICNSVYYRGAAALTTVLASFFLTHGYYQGGTNRTETFLVPCELLAVALYFRGFARDQWWKWYLAGVMAGSAFLFKQVGLAAWGVMGLHTITLVVLQDLRWQDGLRRCLLLLAGVATTLGIASGALAARGALDDAIVATFTFNRAYFAVGASQFPYNFVTLHLLKWHWMPIMRLPTLMAVAAVIHATLWRLRPRFRPAEIEKPLRDYGPVCPRYMLFFGLWFLVAFYGAMMSPHAFRHYLVPTIPPLMLLCGYLVNLLQAELRLLQRLQHRAWVTAAFVAMGYFAAEAFQWQFEQAALVYNDRNPREVNGKLVVRLSDTEAVGERVAQLTTPDQLIQAWGYLPGVYLRAKRINACRYTTTEKIGQVKGEAAFIRDELLDCLPDQRPAVFVITSGDYHWITNPQDYPDNPPDSSGLWLAGWLTGNYTEVDNIRNIYVFQRNDLARTPASDAPNR